DVRRAVLLHAVARAGDPDRGEGPHPGRVPRRARRFRRRGRPSARRRGACAEGEAPQRLRGVDRRAPRAPRARGRGGSPEPVPLRPGSGAPADDHAVRRGPRSTPVSEPARTLEDYRAVAPAGTVDFLRRLSERVRRRRLIDVSATREVGGVAEVLRGLVPLLDEVGVDAGWESLDADGGMAALGARFHHALQGGEERIADELFEEYRRFTRSRAAALDLSADLVVTHDALAAALVEARPPEGAWA